MVDGKAEGRGHTIPIPDDDTRTTDVVSPAAPRPAKRPDEEGPTSPLDAKGLLAQAAAHAELENRLHQRELTSVTMRIDPPKALVRATLPPEDPSKKDPDPTFTRVMPPKDDGRNAPTTPGARVAPPVPTGVRKPPSLGRGAAGRSGAKQAAAAKGRRIPSLEKMESKVASSVMLGTQLALVGALIGVTVVAFRTPAVPLPGASNDEQHPAAIAGPDPAATNVTPAAPPTAETVVQRVEPSTVAPDPPPPPPLVFDPQPAPVTTSASAPVPPPSRASRDRTSHTPVVRGSTVAAAAAMASTTLGAIAPSRPAVAPPPPQTVAAAPPPPPAPAPPPPPPAVTVDRQMQRLTQEADQELNSANTAHTRTGR